jgi:hypothetical protein
MTFNPIYDDTGDIYVGAWSGESVNGSAEAGLLWSKKYMIYEMFGRDQGDTEPDGIPTSMSFLPGVFSEQFGTAGTSLWYFTVTPLLGAPVTWTHPGSSNVAHGTSWTYKQATSIAQNILNPSNGSYFGVNSFGDPLFGWAATVPPGVPLTGSDFFPDSTRALHVGDSYGINLY